MEAVIPVCCAGLLVAYLIGYAIGSERPTLLLLGAGIAASYGALTLAGQALIPALTGSAIGSAVATALLKIASGLSWRLPVNPGEAEPEPASNNSATIGAGSERDIDTSERSPSPKAKKRRKISSRRKHTKRTSRSSQKTPRDSKPPKGTLPQDSLVNEAPQNVASQQESPKETPTEITHPLGSVGPANEITHPLGTVERDPALVLEQEIQRALNEPPGTKRPPVVPRGVFGQEEEPAFALTQRLGSDLLWEAATENLDEEIAPSHCPRCEHRCRPEERYCASCSAPVLPWRCKTCGHRNAVDADFCVRCQAPLELLASPLDVQAVDD